MRQYCCPAGSPNFATLAIQIFLPVLVKGDLPPGSGHLGDPLGGGGGGSSALHSGHQFSGRERWGKADRTV
jgi:hypothetical protein